jgi:glycosyltransferase involved in cell wall biosynthesis
MNINTYPDTPEILPISVIVPLSERRKVFFEQYVMPMLLANHPKEIIINDYFDTAPTKRNTGAASSTQPYLFFCDDDIILPKDYLKTLYNTLQKHPECGYVYTGYVGIVLTADHNIKNNYRERSMPFDAKTLKDHNYISTMALIKKSVFVGFDKELKRFQDWDMWLTMLEKGVTGVYEPNIDFMAFYLDNGLTSKQNPLYDAYNIIKAKHKL